MAVTQNTYTGDGSTVLFSFTFPYLETTDIKVSLDGSTTSAYTLANATTIQFNTAPANGVAIRIYRVTDDSALAAEFFPGSAIRAQDLNDNYTQNLYVTQESNRDSTSAIATANSATTTANTALSTANAASATATTADTNASAAVATANTASTNASTAVSTANTASSNATTAVNTANSAAADAATALSTANTALSTANTADTNASAAVATANTASTNASAAVSTANTASSNASSAVSTANTASSNASTALSTANTAISTANAAASAVATAVLYDVVANVAAIPSSPANNDAVEVSDSTGIESFTPLNGVPAGYVGDSGLSVRIIYTTSGSTWNWIQYFPNDPETRYGDAISTNTADITTLQGDVTTAQSDITTLQGDVSTAQSDITTLQSDVLGLDSSKLAIAGGTMTGALGVAAGTASSPSLFISGDTNTGIYSPGADQVAISTNGTRRISIDNGGYVVVGDGTVSPAGVGAGPTLSITGDAPEITLRDSAAGTPYAWIATNDTGGLTLGADHGNTAAGSNIDFRVDGSERARIDSSGRLLVGTSSSAAIGSGAAASVQVATNASSIHQSWIDYSNGNNPSRIVLGKSISGTIGTAGAGIPANYILGELRFAGSNATDLTAIGAKIEAANDGGTWASGDTPGRLVFSTTADGASSPTERMRISNTGALGLSGANYGTSGQVLTSQGSGSAPQWANAGGAWNLIGSVTANNSSSVAFTSGISNTYNVYVLVGEGLVTAAAEYDYIRLRFSSNGGSSWISSAYEYFNGTNTFNKSNIELLSYYAGTSRSGSFMLWIYNLRNSLWPQMFGNRINISNYDTMSEATIRGMLMNTSTINAMQLSTVSANIASGSFRLYGISNS